MGYSPWGRKESDTTERLTHTHTHTHTHTMCIQCRSLHILTSKIKTLSLKAYCVPDLLCAGWCSKHEWATLPPSLAHSLGAVTHKADSSSRQNEIQARQRHQEIWCTDREIHPDKRSKITFPSIQRVMQKVIRIQYPEVPLLSRSLLWVPSLNLSHPHYKFSLSS